LGLYHQLVTAFHPVYGRMGVWLCDTTWYSGSDPGSGLIDAVLIHNHRVVKM
jgi:hypothetical protein